MKTELEVRPTQDELDEKIQQCNALRTELTDLTEQMACNEKLLEQLQMELSEERELCKSMMVKCLNECGIQTDEIESTKYEVPAKVIEINAVTSDFSVLPSTDTFDIKLKQSENVTEADQNLHISQTEMPQQQTLDESIRSSITESTEESMMMSKATPEDDDELNNHPKVLYEDELIVFKERCKCLTDDNIRLQREIGELRSTMTHFQSNWLHNLMLKYLVPVLMVFIAYFILFK